MTAVTIDRQDARFDTLKKGHNLRFPSTDAEAAGRILICRDAEECAAALQHVVSAGLRPTVRSGGDCYEDFVSNNPNGAILDLSLHNRVDAEPVGTPSASHRERLLVTCTKRSTSGMACRFRPAPVIASVPAATSRVAAMVCSPD
jgi:FAD/FMN-containing dehydrogenase